MKISELQELLEEKKEEHGDVEIKIERAHGEGDRTVMTNSELEEGKIFYSEREEALQIV